mgnify:CR=1 FL=1
MYKRQPPLSNSADPLKLTVGWLTSASNKISAILPGSVYVSHPVTTTLAAPPPAVLPSTAPPAAAMPSFVFGGGRAVQSSSDPVEVYRGLLEYALRSRWSRPADVADTLFVAEVEVEVDRSGRVSDPQWKKRSGHERWDASVLEAVAATTALTRPPPTNFPPRVLVRFDVQETAADGPP